MIICVRVLLYMINSNEESNMYCSLCYSTLQVKLLRTIQAPYIRLTLGIAIRSLLKPPLILSVLGV